MTTLDQKQIEKIMQRAQKRRGQFGVRNTILEAVHQMYLMLDDQNTMKKKMGRRDKKDVRLTITPSARNEVTGMHRLLKTGQPRFVAKSETMGDGIADKIEKACDAMWQVSCEVKRAPVHHDLALSAILDADVNLAVRSLTDVLSMKLLPAYQRARIESIRKRTPYLFEALPAISCYPEFDSYGQRSHYRRVQAWGYELAEEWGAPDLDTESQYYLNEWWDLENRVVWVDGMPPLVAKAHGLPRFPIITTLADGSELFSNEEQKRQPFLYAKWAGNLYENENLTLTALFTSILERGTGPLVALDPDSLPANGMIDVNFAGALRYIIAKATLLNDKAFDADLIQIKSLLDQMGSESTIYKQTLGENAAAGTPFSLYAMASQSGQLPLTSPKEAVGKAIRDAMLVALTWIKRENVDNPYIKASEIPDDLDLEVTLEVKLPQDQFRMAQVAAQLKGIVSNEWIHTNILQIDDSKAMRKQIWTEQFGEIRYQELVKQFMQQAQAEAAAAAQAAMGGAGGPPPPGGEGAPGQEPPMMPEGMPAGGMMPGGPDQAMAGGAAQPLTGPLNPREMGGG